MCTQQAIDDAAQLIAQALGILLTGTATHAVAETRAAAAERQLDLSRQIWHTTGTAATFAHVNKQTIAAACRSGALKAGQPAGAGGRWRISASDLDAWLRSDEGRHHVR